MCRDGPRIAARVQGDHERPLRGHDEVTNMTEDKPSGNGPGSQTDVRAPGHKRHDIRENRQAILLGTLGGWLMRLCSLTLRFQIEDRSGISVPGTHPSPVIYALWHNRFFTVPSAWRKICGKTRKSMVLTSASNDGAMVARAMAVFGFGAVRGSSSRRAVAALVGMKRAIEAGFDVCVTPDGPRGPRYVFQPGLVKIAAATHTPIIPIHVRFASAWRLNTWDRFVIPKPFSRVHVIFDHPQRVSAATDEAAFVVERLHLATLLRNGVDDLDPTAQN